MFCIFISEKNWGFLALYFKPWDWNVHFRSGSVSLICRVPILFLYVHDELYTSELPRRICQGYIIGSCLAVNGLVDPPNGHVVHDSGVHDSGADDSSETWA